MAIAYSDGVTKKDIAEKIDQKIKDLPDSITLRVLMDTLKTLPIRITSYRYKRLKQADEKAVENLIKHLT